MSLVGGLAGLDPMQHQAVRVAGLQVTSGTREALVLRLRLEQFDDNGSPIIVEMINATDTHTQTFPQKFTVKSTWSTILDAAKAQNLDSDSPATTSLKALWESFKCHFPIISGINSIRFIIIDEASRNGEMLRLLTLEL